MVAPGYLPTIRSNERARTIYRVSGEPERPPPSDRERHHGCPFHGGAGCSILFIVVSSIHGEPPFAIRTVGSVRRLRMRFAPMLPFHLFAGLTNGRQRQSLLGNLRSSASQAPCERAQPVPRSSVTHGWCRERGIATGGIRVIRRQSVRSHRGPRDRMHG